MDENKLLKAAAHGDAAAFEALIKPHMTSVYNIAYRICGNEADASDAAQDAFLKAFRGISKFKGGAKFSTWLYRIATNAALDTVKSKKRRRAVSLDAEYENEDGFSTYDLPSGEPTSEERAESAETRREVLAALNELPDKFRAVAVLRDINGLSYGEIAEILGVTEGTVKSRLSRARSKLKEILLKNGEHFGK